MKGNPIQIGTGRKIQVDLDYRGAGLFPLEFKRFYVTGPGYYGTEDYERSMVDAGLGMMWSHTYNREVSRASDVAIDAFVFRPDRSVVGFRLTGGVWTPDPDVADKLERLVSGGVHTGWRFTNSTTDEIEMYDAKGLLVSIASRQGLTQTIMRDASSRIASVTDNFGGSLTFTYDSLSRIATLTVPGGNSYQYGYNDTLKALTTVTAPGSTVRTYHYNESQHVPGTPPAPMMTGITDENGVRYATFKYDSELRAISTEYGAGIDKVGVTYDPPTWQDFVVTDALNTARTYQYSLIHGAHRNTAITGPVCPSCGPTATTYDTNGHVASRTDWNGNRTNYTPNTRGLEERRVEGLTSTGATTSVTRTISTQWHANYQLPTAIAEPLRRTTLTYGAPNDSNPGKRGSVLTRTVQATTDTNGSLDFGATLTGTARTWTYTYNTNGRVLTVNGPRTDVTDTTTYAYYANNATCTATVTGASTTGCRGQVATVKNALNHTTTINEYNAHGQPLKITDPNTLVTTLAYDARIRLISRNVGGETTTYTYDNVGQLKKVTMPDASYLEYTYDVAHRLTEIKDNLNNRITYTLDVMGNRTAENVYDPSSVLAQARTRVFSSLNRLSQEIGAASQITTYGYDNQGNVTSIDGPLAGTGDTTTSLYDGLNRLIRVTDPNSGQANYGYNGRDQLASVSDPRSLVTTYAYSGLDDLNTQTSPDTGTTTNTYDAAGNILTSTDAKAQVTTYVYDALNRVTSITYHGGVKHTYAYDGGTNQKGRLTQIVEPNSTTTYSYNQKGRLTAEARTINGITYSTSYGYDPQGRLSSMTYPGGRILTYTLDTLGRMQRINTTKSGVTQTLVSSVAYRPFGPTRSYTFGTGPQTYTRGFDNDGRISSYTLATQTMAVGYDLASRIQTIAQNGMPANTNTYGYDALDRLTSFVGPSVNHGFTYDAVGNRATKTVGAATSTYKYPGTSNRLSSITGSGPRTYVHDSLGSVTADSVNTYTYDTRGRMVTAVSVAGTTNYKLNAVGQRVRKTNPQGDTVYHYDAQGRLIAESSAVGVILKEYVYLGDTPVVVLQ